jgi:mono/diheme cytochrome c family protein
MSASSLRRRRRRWNLLSRFLRFGKRLSIELALASAVVPLAAGCHSKVSLTPQQAEGKHLYDVRCAHCHEDNDLALKKVPPDLHGLFSHKTLPSGIPATDDAVRHNVLAGRGMMPGFAGRFDDEQMAALLAYLHAGML